MSQDGPDLNTDGSKPAVLTYICAAKSLGKKMKFKIVNVCGQKYGKMEKDGYKHSAPFLSFFKCLLIGDTRMLQCKYFDLVRKEHVHPEEDELGWNANYI